MRYRALFLITFLLIYFSNNLPAQINIDIVYPKEGQKVTAADSAFIFGSVKPANVQFSINDKDVKLYPNGAFITILPIEPGEFSFVSVAISPTDTVIDIRNVHIPQYFKTSPKYPLTIDTSYVFPKVDWELTAGDIFRVAFKGSPGYNASFSIEGVAKNFPMKELHPVTSFYWGEARFGQRTPSNDPPVKGIYAGAFFIQPWHIAFKSKISFSLTNQQQDTVKCFAPGSLSIDNSNTPKIGKIIRGVKIAGKRRRFGDQLFLEDSVKLSITGGRGNYYRVIFSQTENEQWVNKNNIKLLPPGAQMPKSMVTVIRSEDFPRKTRITILLQEKLPFRIEQKLKPSALIITFYGVSEIKDWIKLDFGSSVIKDINWEQAAVDVCQITIDLTLVQHWGYDPFYENGCFFLDIKKNPRIAEWPQSLLKDIVVCLDPGHNPDLGAVGPTRLTEKDVNYEISLLLKEKLQQKGAFVFLTHGREDGINLYTRSKLAAFVGADILLSLHFNALPDGANPHKIRGISNYYYHPQSRKLAYLIQQKLFKKTRLHYFGLFRNNLTVCRSPQMISVLTEPAFIIHPEEEILIQSPKYRNNVTDAIIEAMEEFLRECKE